ncbi:hypothetical protein D9M72_478990 [compost metagenome]
MIVLDALEDDRAALVLHQMRRSGRWLQHAALRCQVATQNSDAARLRQGLFARHDDVVIVVGDVLDVVPDRVAGHGQGILVQETHFADRLDHDRETAGVVELLHQVFARRLEVDDRRDVAAEAIPVVEAEIDADAAGKRQEVQHGVGRAADGAVDADGILKGFLRQNVGRLQVLLHHVDDAAAGELGDHSTACVDGRNGRVAGQRHAERFGHRGHGGSRAHGHAASGRTGHALLGVHEFCQRHLAGLHHLGELPDRRTGADILAAPFAVQHRAAGDENNRDIDAGSPHQQARRGLVAAAEQHDAIDRIAADRLFDVHRCKVAEHHRRRT